MIKVCFCSSNGRDYYIRGLVSTNVSSFRTRPFARPAGGCLRNHTISQNFIGHHIFLTIIFIRTREGTHWAKPLLHNLFFSVLGVGLSYMALYTNSKINSGL